MIYERPHCFGREAINAMAESVLLVSYKRVTVCDEMLSAEGCSWKKSIVAAEPSREIFVSLTIDDATKLRREQ